jgi:hypothetical protein
MKATFPADAVGMHERNIPADAVGITSFPAGAMGIHIDA